jgi:integrase
MQFTCLFSSLLHPRYLKILLLRNSGAGGDKCNTGASRYSIANELRHSLSNWLVNKAKVDPKTVQGILRHAKIQTTLDVYAQEDSDEIRAAQGEFLTAVGMNATVH